MGYDVGASIIQGYKLNDFFESSAEEELEYIHNVFEEHWENDDERNWIPKDQQEGVEVERPDYEKGDFYIGMSGSGGHVANRGGPYESEFELLNPVVVKLTIMRVLRKPDHALFNLIADQMEKKEVKNYLLLSESY